MYLRFPRLAFFMLTSALCAVTFSLTSWGLAQGVQKKNLVSSSIPGATLHIGDALGSGGAVTAASGVASLACLYGLYYTLFGRHHHETLKTVRIKEGLFSFAIIMWIATLIPATYIGATKSGVVTKPGVPDNVIASIVAISGQNLAYKAQTPIKAYLIVGWITLLSTIINLILVSIAARHILKHGPERLMTKEGASTTQASPATTHAEDVRHPTNGNSIGTGVPSKEKLEETKVEHTAGPYSVV